MLPVGWQLPPRPYDTRGSQLFNLLVSAANMYGLVRLASRQPFRNSHSCRRRRVLECKAAFGELFRSRERQLCRRLLTTISVHPNVSFPNFLRLNALWR